MRFGYHKAYYRANKSRLTAYKIKWRKKHRKMVLLQNARDRAKQKNVDFNLTVEDISIPKLCPILGISLHNGTRKNSQNSSSIDRIDNSLGYVKGNVWVISNRANAIKRDASFAELKAIVVALESRLGTDNRR